MKFTLQTNVVTDLVYCANIFTCTVKQQAFLLRLFLLNKECLICSWSKRRGIYPSNTTALRKPGSFIEGLFTKAGWSGSGIWPCGMDPGCTALRIKTGVWRPARGRSSNEHIRTLPTRTLVAPNSIPLNPESCCSPKLNYSLATAKGFSTSILPQSWIMMSLRGLSRPSFFVFSIFLTTSWKTAGQLAME